VPEEVPNTPQKIPTAFLKLKADLSWAFHDYYLSNMQPLNPFVDISAKNVTLQGTFFMLELWFWPH